MNNFIVTFKIKSDATYQKRYDSFVDQIKEIAGHIQWDETTSFYCFQADASAEGLCQTLYIKSDFDATKDIMAVIDISNKKLATKGPLVYPGLLSLQLGFH